MKAKDFAKQINSQFESVNIAIGTEGEKQFFSEVTTYVMDLMKDMERIVKERKVIKSESVISIIKEQEQKFKSFQANLSPVLKEATSPDTFKTFFFHIAKNNPEYLSLCDLAWPTPESLERAKEARFHKHIFGGSTRFGR